MKIRETIASALTSQKTECAFFARQAQVKIQVQKLQAARQGAFLMPTKSSANEQNIQPSTRRAPPGQATQAPIGPAGYLLSTARWVLFAMIRFAQNHETLDAPFEHLYGDMPQEVWLLGNNHSGKVALWVQDGAHGLAAFSSRALALAWSKDNPKLGEVKPGKACLCDAKELARMKGVRFIHILDDFLVPLTIEI